MKFIDNFKRKRSYINGEEQARMEIILENADEEDYQAIRDYGRERLNRGYNTGVLATGIAALGSWVVLNIVDYARNRKKHDSDLV